MSAETAAARLAQLADHLGPKARDKISSIVKATRDLDAPDALRWILDKVREVDLPAFAKLVCRLSGGANPAAGIAAVWTASAALDVLYAAVKGHLLSATKYGLSLALYAMFFVFLLQPEPTRLVRNALGCDD
jgi:hypothetical protein